MRWIDYKDYVASRYQLLDQNEKVISFAYQKRKGLICFDDMITLKVTEADQTIFELHYDSSYDEPLKMLSAMDRSLHKEKEIIPYHVLLCCSGGMTTGYFKMRMENYIALRHLPMTIDALAYDFIFQYQKPYDLVLVAPQMRFQLDFVKAQTEAIVDVIDPMVFATYDCEGLWTQIQKYREEE